MTKPNKHSIAIFSAIDRLAREDRLMTATTALISEYARVSEGVMFRHFPSKGAIFDAWIDSRAGRLSVALSGMAAGRTGLLRFIADQIEAGGNLGLLCCQPLDCAPQRARLEALRLEVHAELASRLAALPGLPPNVKAETLTDSLWQALCRAWRDPVGADARALAAHLPWEAEEDPRAGIFPPTEVLGRLALSASGFVFDPVSGGSFTANDTGIAVLRGLQEGSADMARLVESLAQEYDAPPAILERDLMDFAARLREVLR
ncbi:MAG: PqqD family peptide modification chaperone [Gammaproteobacteria bacterium]|nr:PqqD family peptide modification chaperone [Gammaproteobacteria bacterium]MBU1653605.1 PqqD family peptide modification chaperone [Gammaproteobacteria bacterium]MBU1960970.1 PqqD family peptide modification chaperone [Gammaproteobacteria bacterium]